jgi:hypothetical protein
VCVFDGMGNVPDETPGAEGLRRLAAKHISHRWGILLQPLAYGPDYGEGPKMIAARYRGSHMHLFGVGGADDRQSWQRAGIVEWPMDQPLPEFAIEEVLLV